MKTEFTKNGFYFLPDLRSVEFLLMEVTALWTRCCCADFVVVEVIYVVARIRIAVVVEDVVAEVVDISPPPQSHPTVYHGGFYDYVMMTKNCVDHRVRVRLLEKWGFQINYITGHSLGGAAATVYQQLSAKRYNSVRDAKVVTYGAPKTSKKTFM